ncbi:MAG: phage integrase N-terminal SAM-like domain-containing protein, partial [Bacteroidota bacterium]|nr:phage integrase N-terminal SAM-like domain-containing protein [Bacteroidota bacterium]
MLGNQNKPKLLDQVRITLRTNHYSPKTEESYTNWIKRFILFHNKQHPGEMGGEEIKQYLKREVIKIFEYLDGVPKLIVSLLYGGGLRLSEALRLRIKDIDFDY